MNEPEYPVVIVVPGDLHLTKPSRDNAEVAGWVVDEVNQLIRPDFVQFIGDNVQDATDDQFRLFDAIRDRLEVPHFALVGDHDVKDDPPAATEFTRHVGPTYGGTTLRGFRFLRLNTQEARPVGISPEQLRWFATEVDEAITRGERVVLFQHNYPYQIWENFDGPGIDEWRGIVQTRAITAIICGHTHYAQVANDGRNLMLATRSIGDPEGGPPGYTLLSFQGDDFGSTFRSVEDQGPIVLVTHPRERLLATAPHHVVSGPDRVRVRIWHSQVIRAVRSRLDEEAWVELAPAGDGHWSGPIDGDRLTKGEHALKVVASDDNGVEGTHAIQFMVDPTGRYTPFPEVRPVVTSTDFC